LALTEAQDTRSVGQTEARLRFLSEFALLTLRESTSVEVSKSIYERQVWPSRNGDLEKAFIQWAQADSQVLAFCKIIENRATFA
jgi:type III restriction enzyme